VVAEATVFPRMPASGGTRKGNLTIADIAWPAPTFRTWLAARTDD
jgi:hypothetical protein